MAATSVTNTYDHRPPDTTRRFLWLAAGNILIYGVLWAFYTTPWLHEPRLNRELLVWPVTFLLLWLYWAGYRLVAAKAIPLSWLVGSGLILAIVAALVPPFHSTDIFGYINRGWQQLHYHLNPYVYTIDQIPDWEHDPMITDHWVNNPSPYGFLYLLLAKFLCWLGAGNKANTVLLFKLGNVIAHGLTALLIWLGIDALNKDSRKKRSGNSGYLDPNLAIYLYLWNPLVLVHGLANGHNDMIMGLFITLSVYCATRNWLAGILPTLMTATLIKYGAVVIVPLAIVFLIRRRAWISLEWGVVLAALVFLLTGFPYLVDWQQFHLAEINRNAFVSHGSIHSLIYSIYKTLGKEAFPVLYQYRELARAILKNLLLLGYMVVYGTLAWRRFRQAEYTTLQWIWDSLLVMTLLICLVSLKFYPWYLGMFFPLALFLPAGDWLRRFVVVLSGAQLLSITFIGQAHLLNFILMTAIPIGWIVWTHRKRQPQSSVTPAQPSAPTS
jgi:hypothetical protein